MSFSTLMDLAWILKMLVLPSRSGSENSTFLSSLPGLQRAGSRVGPVGGHEHLDIAPRVEAIQLIDELQHGPLHLIVPTSPVIKPCTAHGVNLIEENETGFLSPCHLEELPDHPRSLPDIL